MYSNFTEADKLYIIFSGQQNIKKTFRSNYCSTNLACFEQKKVKIMEMDTKLNSICGIYERHFRFFKFLAARLASKFAKGTIITLL